MVAISHHAAIKSVGPRNTDGFYPFNCLLDYFPPQSQLTLMMLIWCSARKQLFDSKVPGQGEAMVVWHCLPWDDNDVLQFNVGSEPLVSPTGIEPETI